MIASVAQSEWRKLSDQQAEVIRAELESILASESFASSKRCQDFLRCVVQHALCGDFESLTERFLGVELFGRAVDYETATDSIVRVRANDVRRRLAQYYAGRRAASAARIDLIAGGYVPEFHWQSEEEPEFSSGFVAVSSTVSPAVVSPADAFLPSTVAPSRTRFGHRERTIWWYGIITAAVVVAGVLLGMRVHRSNFDRFWQPIMDAQGSPVLNLPTTDTFQVNLDSMRTLNELGHLEPGQSVTLKQGDYFGFHDWHVSLPVLQATLSVSMALARMGKTPLVRIGTDMRRDELRGHPIIAIGSFSNPWTEQNVSGLRFTFDRGASDRESPRIRDAQNPARTWSLEHIFPEVQTKDYAIVTRTFDPVTREPFLSLAGLHSFGNQTAGEFVAQKSSWDEVARRAPAGWEKMNMQVLLETSIVGTTPGSPRIVDVYFWK